MGLATNKAALLLEGERRLHQRTSHRTREEHHTRSQVKSISCASMSSYFFFSFSSSHQCSGDGTLSVFHMRKAGLESQSDNMEDELLSIVILKALHPHLALNANKLFSGPTFFRSSLCSMVVKLFVAPRTAYWTFGRGASGVTSATAFLVIHNP